MKKRLMGMTGVLALVLMGAMFLAPSCKAQSEISPDHFDGTDSWAAAELTSQPARPAPSIAKAAMRTQGQRRVLASTPFAFTAGRMALPEDAYRVQKSPASSVMPPARRKDLSAPPLVTSMPAQSTVFARLIVPHP